MHFISKITNLLKILIKETQLRLSENLENRLSAKISYKMLSRTLNDYRVLKVIESRLYFTGTQTRKPKV